MDPERFVFIDETATTTNMTRRYGRCPSHMRLVAKAPYGHWKTTPFVAGLDHGATGARWVDDGAAFRAYAERFLAPALKPDDIVVMVNLSAYEVAGVRQAIERAGASALYLPPHSPDLKPTEQLFAKIQGRALERHWHSSQTMRRQRIRRLSQKLRLWIYVNEKCSSAFSGEGWHRVNHTLASMH